MSMLMLAKIALTIRHGTNHTSSSPGVCSGSCIHHNLRHQEAYMKLSINVADPKQKFRIRIQPKVNFESGFESRI
jgi:hypothetical protein